MQEVIKNLIKKVIILYVYPLYQNLLVFRLRYKKKINVVFFASSLPMWRHQHLYELMIKYPKFNPQIIILSSSTYSKLAQENDVKLLREYFDTKGIPYVLGVQKDGGVFDVKKAIAPDILFYPQPYVSYYQNQFSYKRFFNKLLCYTPYAFWTSKDAWSYALLLHKMSWKLFYSTELHRDDAAKYSPRGSTNVEIVGYPTADDFVKVLHTYKWKPQSSIKKKLIWAPHFTICDGGYLTQSNFLWMSELMIDIAKKYSDVIQIVFKPHPRLYTELCKHPLWGEEQAARYFNLWATLDNTQIEDGEFVDLFMTSDAMIHDCGSFAVEYHYSENPVLYVAPDFERQLEEKNEFGKLAMRQHYVGRCEQDIVRFIEDVVLAGNDPMKERRVRFKKDYLLPPNGKTVAENIMDVFLKAFC